MQVSEKFRSDAKIFLEQYGLDGHLVDFKTPPDHVISSTGKYHCIACGQLVKNHHILGKYHFCEQCFETPNEQADYQQAFDKAATWMSPFYSLKKSYSIHLMWFPINLGIRPIKKGRKNVIKCRAYMRRDVIEVRMIGMYVELCFKEIWKDKQLRKAFQQKRYKGKSRKEIPYWYMAQYLYMTGRKEQADIIVSDYCQEIKKSHRLIWYVPGVNSDDRKVLNITLKTHPLYI